MSARFRIHTVRRGTQFFGVILKSDGTYKTRTEATASRAAARVAARTLVTESLGGTLVSRLNRKTEMQPHNHLLPAAVGVRSRARKARR